MDNNYNAPLVSVLVPVYNSELTLDRCLLSIRRQTYPKLEIICINDGSTDHSFDILREHQSCDSRIIIIDKDNEGYGAALNNGIDIAEGKWISIVESDDWLDSHMYEDMLVYAEEFEYINPLDIVEAPFWHVRREENERFYRFRVNYYNRVNPSSQPFNISEGVHLIMHHPSIWSALYRRDFLNKYDIRFIEEPGAGWTDNPFMIETLLLADRIGYLNKPYYFYVTDTEEEYAEFIKRNWEIPIARLHDILNVRDRLCVSDKEVLQAINRRCFTYIRNIIDILGDDKKVIQQAIACVFERLDYRLVLEDNKIPPMDKELFAAYRRLPDANIDNMAYSQYVLGEGIYSLANSGLKDTLYKTKHFVNKRILSPLFEN